MAPLFVYPITRRFIKDWRHEVCPVGGRIPKIKSVIFDSGGYQVQMGKLTYDELCRKLRDLIEREAWADMFVLPDHVPRTSDSDSDVERKIAETLTVGEQFLKWLPSPDRAVGVVHGRTLQHIKLGVRKWHEVGVTYIAFGSFGTSGRNGSVNMLSEHSLKLLQVLQDEARSFGMKWHIFGIGNPVYLMRLKSEGLEPTSFDTTGWWKAGGFGRVFLPHTKGFHITYDDGFRQFLEAKTQSQHQCPFCVDDSIKSTRLLRILHNLVSLCETVASVRKTASLPAKEQSDYAQLSLPIGMGGISECCG